jgi:hypothetical protein
MPSACAAAWARVRSRDAIATIRQCALCCIAGITFCMAILAVPITPKRTGSMARPLVAVRCGRYNPAASLATERSDEKQAERSRGTLRLRQSVT